MKGKKILNEYDQLRKNAERYRALYPVGMRIELIHMGQDKNPIPDGTRGIVTAIDDVGIIHCNFDNGRSLGVSHTNNGTHRTLKTIFMLIFGIVRTRCGRGSVRSKSCSARCGLNEVGYDHNKKGGRTMPNHVTNHIELSGDREQIKEMFTAKKKPCRS